MTGISKLRVVYDTRRGGMFHIEVDSGPALVEDPDNDGEFIEVGRKWETVEIPGMVADLKYDLGKSSAEEDFQLGSFVITSSHNEQRTQRLELVFNLEAYPSAGENDHEVIYNLRGAS